ncbi:peptidylprolyl isomerase [Gilvimarinus xylanilyticus]|uniref:Peptidyl-prolyl cis-trans isomerase n=1 Tax=Gilvimarinus xylanilyticus TaxID=2944139 RepID=A0A9X2KTC1_9GAMM|nr:peptidylprolyl isomerase [Gilvimarinus xylanilyticus]MCP8899114.1 peptidylprolyl isomerase [Gilvimarinus xylanilyticus]
MHYSRNILAGMALTVMATAPAYATTVQFQTVMGDFEVNLFDETTPETVANFLEYVEGGAYQDTFMHRSVPGFIMQGGGFTFDIETDSAAEIASNEMVINEPIYSNQRGTIAMAKLGGNPDSATNQWFFNLADNSTNLDNQNDGFTVFGQVMGNGMAIIDAMAELKFGNFSGDDFLGEYPFEDMPVRDYSQEDYDSTVALTEENIVLIQNIVVLDAAPDTAADLDPKPSTKGENNGGDNGGDSGGGGGSTGLLALLALAGLALGRRLFKARA